eukprot:1118773-Pleurochrysis_carterae.AAC.2
MGLGRVRTFWPSFVPQEDGSVVEVARSVASSSGTPFDREKEGSDIPLASHSDVGTQGKSCVCRRSLSFILPQSSQETREGECSAEMAREVAGRHRDIGGATGEQSALHCIPVSLPIVTHGCLSVK